MTPEKFAACKARIAEAAQALVDGMEAMATALEPCWWSDLRLPAAGEWLVYDGQTKPPETRPLLVSVDNGPKTITTVAMCKPELLVGLCWRGAGIDQPIKKGDRYTPINLLASRLALEKYLAGSQS